ncbi:aminoglycoside phosphotransferase family protein [Pseudarthrobacter sulfonivorans]|uniref:aminoglycoside phosphotransferase family protein n=1 Tax=Pseudarthrobacter sulfonivorans TaxID=121292 RepID=UPI0021021717|nr:aminoglycoside phosphotransferase family protein [Pseudarthrobacter sulfonivorans]
MSLGTEVAVPPALSVRYGRTSAGRAWLSSLPDLVHGRLQHWELAVDLEPGAFPWHGHGGMVIPVRRRDGALAALKIAFPHDEAKAERHALSLWGGSGAVRLLDSDAGTCAMLLERLDPGYSLQTVPLPEAASVWGGLMRKLSLVPGDEPGWQEFDHIAGRAEQWSDDLPADWEQQGRPFPRWLLEAALEVCQVRGAVGRRSGRDVLVHTDFHYLNVLARPRSAVRSGTAGPDTTEFVAIDPQPMIGEPEFAVAPLLWNRLQELPRSNPAGGLRQRCGDFSDAAGLDADVARQWAVAREVENALWYASRPGHRGDLARSLWVSSTLAGRTLDGLPAAHDLPEPGQSGS